MYTVSGCSGPASTTFPITVADIDGVSGYVNFTFEPYYGPVKVRLITQSTSGTTGNTVLTEYASTSGECNGTSYYYEFIGVPTNTYLIKAANNDSMASDYLPTYAPSEAFWNAPFTTQLVHTSGTADINQNITMLHGAVTSGPGFISGDVVVDHANKGTSGTIPAIGLHIILKNNSSSSILKFIDTDPSGHYSFSGLPYGTYSIFPDSMSYISTAYTTITLSAAHPSDATAGFTQHTVSQTITPSAATAVSNIAAVTYGVSAFPNPSNGRVIIQWNEKATENGTVIVTDITGREVYKSTINMIQGNGSTPIDLTAVSNGLYTISITSASLTYKDKLEIAR